MIETFHTMQAKLEATPHLLRLGRLLAQFWQPLPAPGFHDIFGLLKVGRGNIDGDILCLVKNLRFFKEFMALPRTKREDAA